MAAQLDLPRTETGLVVTDVDPAGVAASVGLQAGDIIKSVDGRRVTSMPALRAALATHTEKPALVLVSRPTYPIPSTTVQVYRAIYSDLSQYALLFDGKVKKATFNNKVINVECSVDDEVTIMLPHIVY